MISFASPALAITQGHTYSFSFGSSGTGDGQFSPETQSGQGIARDNSTGDLYVTDSGSSRILKFDSTGTFLEAWGYGVDDGSNESQVCIGSCQAGIYGAQPGQFAHPTDIAVDNSAGPNAGDVYVADTDHQDVLKFDSDGSFLGRINGSDTPGGIFVSLPSEGAVAVDGNGFLWIAPRTTLGGGRIMKFSNDSESEYVGGSEWTQAAENFAIAPNSTGTKLLLDGFQENPATFIVGSTGSDPGEPIGCGGRFNGSVEIDYGSGNLFVGNGTEVCEFNSVGIPIQRFKVEGMSTQGIAVDPDTGTVYVASMHEVDVFIRRIVPDVTIGPATAIGEATATLTGDVSPDPSGGGDVTSCSFQYMEDAQYKFFHKFGIPDDLIYGFLGTLVPCDPATPYTGPTSVTAEATGLPPETPYTYRLSAGNSIDSQGSANRIVTAHYVAGITTEAGSEITPAGVTLNGSFDPNGDDTHYYFEWGPDTSYGNVTAEAPGLDAGSGVGTKPVSAEIAELNSFTTYHYRLVAVNSKGTSFGNDEAVRTAAPPPPAVSGSGISKVTDDGAALTATINPNFGDTTFMFQYGTTEAYGVHTQVGEPIGADHLDHSVDAVLSGLDPGTTYHVRVLATNFGGATPGPDLIFTTVAAPGIESTGSTSVGTTSATLIAQVAPNRSPTSYHFDYGTSEAYGTSTGAAALGDDSVSHGASASISGLAPATTYHFRVVAQNAAGTTYGPDETLTTASTARVPHQGGEPPGCEKLDQQAKRSRRRAKYLLEQANEADNALRARMLRSRSRKLAKHAKQLDRKAKACARKSREVGL
jgi:hypothetical protein